MRRINSYKIFSNNNEKASYIKQIVNEKMRQNGFEEKEEGYDLGIAIGGDGSFLRMVNQSDFNSDTFYVGVNAGTLGFAQNISIENIDLFISDLKAGNFKVDKVGIQETKVITSNHEDNFYSLNEVTIREENLNTLLLDVYVKDDLLEQFAGDGILVATSFGSTAHNSSLSGSIVYNTFDTLQITSIAALNNKSYRNLLNSVILPSGMKVTLKPKRSKDLLIIVDGTAKVYKNVDRVETIMGDKKINCLRDKKDSFCKKIREKFLL